jgi:hypothetical protein
MAVVALVAALLGSRGDDSGAAGPPPLRLGAIGVHTTDAAASAESSASTSVAVGGGYRLEGELPDDGPERGAVHRPADGKAGAEQVRRLAAALGIEREPRGDGERWTLTSGLSTLDVTDEPGRPWWYGQAVPMPMPVEPVPGTESGGGSAGCTPPDASGTAHCVAAAPPPDLPLPEPTADPVTADAALAAVRPLLDALDALD